MENQKGWHPTAKKSIVVELQYVENYGAHEWVEGESEGECPQRWKFKGGKTILVHNVEREATALALVMDRFCYSNYRAKQFIVDWQFYDGERKEAYDNEVSEWMEDEYLRPSQVKTEEQFPVIVMPD